LLRNSKRSTFARSSHVVAMVLQKMIKEAQVRHFAKSETDAKKLEIV